jgi:hypothetical protein
MELDNETRKQMGLAGRQKMEREFNREIVIDAYMREIEQVEYALQQSRHEKDLMVNGLQENN